MNVTAGQITATLQGGKITSFLESITGLLQGISASIAAPLGVNHIIVLVFLSFIIGAGIKSVTGWSLFSMSIIAFVFLLLLKIGVIR